jgi:pantetheine-phosphate adenylyltransferase
VRDFAVASKASAMVRGVRSVTDFDFETQLAGMNRALAPNVETVLMLPDAHYQYISSTLVREIATLKGDISQFVAPSVQTRLLQKIASSTS